MQKATEILQKQTSLFGKEELTFYEEDFHANPSQQQAKEREQAMTAISGKKCLEQYEKFNRPGLWAKMFVASLIGMEGWYSTKCNLTWKLKATKSHRFYLQLAPSTHLTGEIGFGLLPTPAAMEGFNTGQPYLTETGTIRNKNKDGSSSRMGLGFVIG